MRPALLLNLLLLSFAPVFSQPTDLFQPVELMSRNRVQKRVIMFDHSRNNYRLVDYFNIQGFRTQHIEYDSTGRKILSRWRSVYNDSTKLTSDTSFIYAEYDTALKKHIFKAHPDTLVATIEKDFEKKTSSRIFKKREGKIVQKSEYNWGELKEVLQYFKNDTLTSVVEIIYEKPYVEKTVHVKIMNGESYKEYNYSYKNSFNKQGAVTHRMLQSNVELPPGSRLFNEYEYQYMRNGLIMSRSHTDNRNWGYKMIFDYEFY